MKEEDTVIEIPPEAKPAKPPPGRIARLGAWWNRQVEERVWLGNVIGFLKHPNTLRVIFLALGIYAAIQSGGIFLAVATGISAVGAAVSIYGKAKQLYNAERAAQQHLITKMIGKEDDAINLMLTNLAAHKDAKKTISAATKGKNHHVDVSRASFDESLREVARYGVWERLVGIVTAFGHLNLVSGIRQTIMGIYSFKSEAAVIMEAKKEERQLWLEVNDRCKTYHIKEYKNSDQLFEYFIDKKSTRLALEMTIKECKERKVEFDIKRFEELKAQEYQKLHDGALQVFKHKKKPTEDEPMQSASKWRRLWNSLYRNKELEDINRDYSVVRENVRLPRSSQALVRHQLQKGVERAAVKAVEPMSGMVVAEATKSVGSPRSSAQLAPHESRLAVKQRAVEVAKAAGSLMVHDRGGQRHKPAREATTPVTRVRQQ